LGEYYAHYDNADLPKNGDEAPATIPKAWQTGLLGTLCPNERTGQIPGRKMMQRQESNRALIIFLLSSLLILGLTACNGQSESAAPASATTAVEKATRTPAPTEKATATE
jgi:hypothetical protein